MTATTKLKPEALRKMQDRYFWAAVHTPSRVHMLVTDIEPDGRKRKAVLDALEANDHTKPVPERDDVRELTNLFISDTTQPESVDLIEMWEKEQEHRRNRHTFVRPFPMHSKSAFTPGQLLTILNTHDHFRWYVVPDAVLNYDHAYEEKDRHGPYTLAEAAVKWQEACEGKLDPNRRHGSWEIVVGMEALDKHILKKFFDERVQHAFERNLAWGMVKLGIVAEEDGKLIKSETTDHFLLMASSKHVSLGCEPDKWGLRVSQAIDGNLMTLESIQRKLVLLRKIEKGIEAYGGWEKFLTDYKARLVEELTKQVSDETQAKTQEG